MTKNDFDWLFTQPRLYDNLFQGFTNDLTLFKKLFRKYGDPGLDLMCGTGRVTIPMAQQGYDLTGLDNSPFMLDIAREKARKAGVDIDWAESDARDISLGRKFNLIYIAFNSFLEFTDDRDMDKCLTNIRNALTDKGRLFIDIFNPDFKILLRSPEQRFPVDEINDADGRGKIVITEKTDYSVAGQILNIRWYFRYNDTGEDKIYNFRLRILFPREIDAIMRYCGFTIENKFGDYDLSPFVSSSPKQLLVCRRA
jgi:SAM-dependent methyltransferase